MPGFHFLLWLFQVLVSYITCFVQSVLRTYIIQQVAQQVALFFFPQTPVFYNSKWSTHSMTKHILWSLFSRSGDIFSSHPGSLNDKLKTVHASCPADGLHNTLLKYLRCESATLVSLNFFGYPKMCETFGQSVDNDLEWYLPQGNSF